MKKFMLSLLLLISLATHAQCDQATAWVFSIAPGYAKTGAAFSMEAGLWPVAGKVGVLAGPAMYSRRQVVKDKTETVTEIDLAGRLVFKITDLGDNCPQLMTVFATARGNVGASYRGYISLGRSDLVGVEPFYSSRTGMGINLLFTTRL
jgi:hypothetical protein